MPLSIFFKINIRRKKLGRLKIILFKKFKFLIRRYNGIKKDNPKKTLLVKAKTEKKHIM